MSRDPLAPDTIAALIERLRGRAASWDVWIDDGLFTERGYSVEQMRWHRQLDLDAGAALTASEEARQKAERERLQWPDDLEAGVRHALEVASMQPDLSTALNAIQAQIDCHTAVPPKPYECYQCGAVRDFAATRLVDAQDDALRLHREKMNEWERAQAAESCLAEVEAALREAGAHLDGALHHLQADGALSRAMLADLIRTARRLLERKL